MTPQELLQSLEQRKQKNLAFFQEYFPYIYDMFKDATMENARLNISPSTLEVNLVENDKAVYPEPVAEFNEREAEQFSNIFKEGLDNKSISHNSYQDFYHGRYAHGLTARFLKRLGIEDGSRVSGIYEFGHSLPQVVFLGCGLGLHIKALLAKRPIKHVVVVEHNPDRFLASLYVTDWEELIRPYFGDPQRAFTLCVGKTQELEEDDQLHHAMASAWNNICSNVPFFPAQTVFYIHQSDPFYTKVADLLNDEMEVFINVWGYYDDEINQFNHLIHNIKNQIKIMPHLDMSGDEKITLVCGNGPSIDKIMPLIKKYRNKLNLISGGSTTETLYKNDIIPDICVSIESDLSSFEAFDLYQKDKLKKTNFIGAAQIHPYTFNLFNKSLMYIKHETSYASIFSKDDSVAMGTPSATNAALAVALDLKFSNIYLSGLDYGYQSKTETHSQSSFYRDENTADFIKEYTKSLENDSYFLEENEFGKIYTTAFYNTAKSHAVRKIMGSGREDIINLSQGATIKGTQWGDIKDLESLLENLTIKDTSFNFFDELYENARLIREAEIESGIKKIRSTFIEFRKKTNEILDSMEPNIDSIEQAVFKISQMISNPNRIKNGTALLFIRGSIWTWIFNFYTIAKRKYPVEGLTLEKLAKTWKKDFLFFIDNLNKHFNQFLTDDAATNQRINLSVADPEPGIEQWFNAADKNHNTPNK